MNYKQIEQAITHEGRDRYINYLRKLENEKKNVNNQWVVKNAWFTRYDEQKYIDLYNIVLATGVCIDGDTVTLSTIGLEVVPNFNYQAYKNLVLARYPETKFDFQIVYAGDSFTFRKESGKVIYTHVFTDPFSNNREVIGAYGVIKNSTGEFIELINTAEIAKMRNSAKTDIIWREWFGEMVKKSIIKRVCKVNFKDIVHEIEEIDNENYEPNNADLDYNLREEVGRCTTVAQINSIYIREKGVTKELNKLIEMCSKQKAAIEVTPVSPLWSEVKSKIESGVLADVIMKEYYISEENLSTLLSECI